MSGRLFNHFSFSLFSYFSLVVFSPFFKLLHACLGFICQLTFNLQGSLSIKANEEGCFGRHVHHFSVSKSEKKICLKLFKTFCCQHAYCYNLTLKVFMNLKKMQKTSLSVDLKATFEAFKIQRLSVIGFTVTTVHQS